MEQFASGWKRNYYGKGDVTVYRLHRDGSAPGGQSPVLGANVLVLLYGEAFWPTYTTGDNTDLIATDSMKNFIQRETLNYEGACLDGLCEFLGSKFLSIYPQVEGAQVSAVEVPYAAIGPENIAFAPGGPDRATARVEIGRAGCVEAVSGIRGFKLLRLGGSAFRGFVRDQYTTLPDMADRPLHMWLDLEWSYCDTSAAINGGAAVADARRIVHEVFRGFESGSIQQVIYRIGTRMLEELPIIAEVHLEAQNRTWDAIAEDGKRTGVFTESRPPYGCLGLRLKR